MTNYVSALARIDVVLDGPINITETELKIVERITCLLADRHSDDRRHIYDLVELSLTGVSIGKSIIFHFRCFRESDLNRMQNILESGFLKKIVENVVNYILADSVIVAVEIRNTVADLALYYQYLASGKLKPKIA